MCQSHVISTLIVSGRGQGSEVERWSSLTNERADFSRVCFMYTQRSFHKLCSFFPMFCCSTLYMFYLFFNFFYCAAGAYWRSQKFVQSVKYVILNSPLHLYHLLPLFSSIWMSKTQLKYSFSHPLSALVLIVYFIIILSSCWWYWRLNLRSCA
jgi:hypothetical protein